MSHARWWAAAATLGLALVAGEYLAGTLTLLLLGLDPGLLRPTTYLDYLRALDVPAVQPYAGRIRFAGTLGFAVPTAVTGFIGWRLLRPAARSLHGDARFARADDLRRRGLFRRDAYGLVIGRYHGRLLRLPGPDFALLAAPTRSGKGVGIVIPNLLEYAGSAVVLDIKQENHAITSGWRQSQGQDVYLFNPFAEDGRTHRWNPLHYVSPDPALRIADVIAIGALLYPDGPAEQKFWVSQARNAFLAFTLALFDRYDAAPAAAGAPAEPTLGGVYRLSSGDGGDADARRTCQALARQPGLAHATRTAFANLLAQADPTFGSILGTFKEPLNAWVHPVLDAATSADDFLLTDLRRRRMTIYVGIQPNKLAEARIVLNLFFSQLIAQNTRELPQHNPALREPCLLLLDEFSAVGRIESIASAVAYMAGYNLRLLPIIQSTAQLDAVYGKDAARTIVTNHALQILFAPGDQRDAEDYSAMLGYASVRHTHVTRGRHRADVSHSDSEERRALLLPQELRALRATQQVLVLTGLPHPVLCRKIRYYEDGHFRRRLLPPVPVPALAPGHGADQYVAGGQPA